MIQKSEFLDKVRSCRMFEGLNEQVIEDIYNNGRIITIPGDHTLLKEGEMNPFLYFVLTGELRIYLPQGDKRFSEIHLNELGPNTVIGEYSFVDMKPSSASVISTQETTLFEVRKSDFQKVIESATSFSHIVYKNLLRILVQRCRECNAELDVFTSL